MTTSNTCTTGPPSRTVLAERTVSEPPSTSTCTLLTDETAPVRDRGRCTRAGAARLRLADSAFPDPHRGRVGAGDRDELDVGATREARVVLDPRAVGDHGRRRGIVDEEDEVRVADTGGVAVIRRAVDTASRSNGDAASTGSAPGRT